MGLLYLSLLQKNRQNKVREEQKTEIQSSQRAKKKKLAELVANLSLDGLDGHEQRLIGARLRAIVLTKITACIELENLKEPKG